MHKLSKLCVNLTNCNNLIRLSNKKIIKPSAVCGVYSRNQSNATNTCNNNAVARTTLNFDDVIKRRRIESQHSILVQVNSDKSYPELYSYCSQFGHIASAHHYTQDELHYILVEYSSEIEANEAIKSSSYNEDNSVVVVQSPFLWFRAGSRTATKFENLDAPALAIVDGNRKFDDDELIDLLDSCEKLGDQMKLLHKATCLNDIGIRLRFLAGRQLEQAISGMFPYAQACPFGSSVNGFGKLGCDLDLILRLSSDEQRSKSQSRLVYHTKEHLTNGRAQTQRHMENFSDILHLFLPGVGHVRRILQARVPIIKYHHDHLDLEVDLSMSNLTGVYMSELLYMFGQIDDRVMPLVFSIRKWAQKVGLTNPSPGRWISNFSLTCLVVFYLQQLSHPILPSIHQLIKQARPEDVRITEDNIKCTFLRDLNQLQFTKSNTTSLDELFQNFFEYYSQIDFNERAISLIEGRTVIKPDHSPIYIINPIEPCLNVSKNISLEECERFRIEVRNAAWLLDEHQTKSSDSPWGIMSLFKISNKSKNGLIRPSMFFKPRMVDVSELFEDKTKEPSESEPSLNRLIKFKNSFVKNEIVKIQKQGRIDGQKIKLAETGGSGLPTRVRKR